MMKNNKLGIYVHIPFCVKKCDYCDFLSAPAGEKRIKEYMTQLLREISLWNTYFKDKNREVDTIFIGGGTPSILSIIDISRLLSDIKRNFKVTDQAEISIECNPGTITKDKLETYRDIGINRLSIGMQSSFDSELRQLGRIHSYQEFCEAFDTAREIGFNNINVDIMAAIPGQTENSYETTLHRVIEKAPEHISSYSLIIEEGTPFYERYKENPPMDEETDRILYERTNKILSQSGYERYEISNYAKPGYCCRHNMKYWQREEYIGIGVGAASFMEERRFSNFRSMTDYEHAIGQNHLPVAEVETISQKEAMAEYMYLGLRCKNGISTKAFFSDFKVKIDEVYGDVIDKYIKAELLRKKEDQIALTNKGIDVSNRIFADFL